MNRIQLSLVGIILLTSISMADRNFIAPDIEVNDYQIAPLNNENYDLYLGVAYSYMNADIDGTQEGSAYTLLAGYNIYEYLAIEARYSHTVGDLDTEYYGDKERLMTNAALYLKPQYEVLDALNIYALLGYGQTLAVQSTDEGFQWGVGLSYNVVEDLNLFVDYQNINNSTMYDVYNIKGNNYNSDIAVTNVGISYHF